MPIDFRRVAVEPVPQARHIARLMQDRGRPPVEEVERRGDGLAGDVSARTSLAEPHSAVRALQPDQHVGRLGAHCRRMGEAVAERDGEARDAEARNAHGSGGRAAKYAR